MAGLWGRFRLPFGSVLLLAPGCQYSIYEEVVTFYCRSLGQYIAAGVRTLWTSLYQLVSVLLDQSVAAGVRTPGPVCIS